jgi:hypothetical protein
MSPKPRSVRQEQATLVAALRESQNTWGDIARILAERFLVNYRVAFRLAHGWSQREAADRWNERWPAEPKTFKNFSYWEVWPSSTGHAPSLNVLIRLAELYECSVAELLLDCADYRHHDSAHQVRRHLARAEEPVALSHAPGDLDSLVSQFDGLGVGELAQLAVEWASRIDSPESRRSLMLKLSTALGIAANNDDPSSIDGIPMEFTPPADITVVNLAGIWRSRYQYYSSGRQQDFEGEHYVVLRADRKRLVGQSLPHTSGSKLRIEIVVEGSVATGTWVEQTSPTGHYRGISYHGSIQLLVDPVGRGMKGKWVGFGKNFTVNTGPWQLDWVDEAISQKTARQYYFKA